MKIDTFTNFVRLHYGGDSAAGLDEANKYPGARLANCDERPWCRRNSHDRFRKNSISELLFIVDKIYNASFVWFILDIAMRYSVMNLCGEDQFSML